MIRVKKCGIAYFIFIVFIDGSITKSRRSAPKNKNIKQYVNLSVSNKTFTDSKRIQSFKGRLTKDKNTKNLIYMDMSTKYTADTVIKNKKKTSYSNHSNKVGYSLCDATGSSTQSMEQQDTTFSSLHSKDVKMAKNFKSFVTIYFAQHITEVFTTTTSFNLCVLTHLNANKIKQHNQNYLVHLYFKLAQIHYSLYKHQLIDEIMILIIKHLFIFKINSKILDLDIIFKGHVTFGKSLQTEQNIFEWENHNKEQFDILETTEQWDYKNAILNIFYVNKDQKMIKPYLWSLMVYMPEIIFYIEWKLEEYKKHSDEYIEKTKQSNVDEVVIICNLLHKYLNLCMASGNNDCALIDKALAGLNKIISDLRSHISTFLTNYYNKSIHNFIYNMGMGFLDHDIKRVLKAEKNLFVCFLLAFTIKNEEIGLFCINSDDDCSNLNSTQKFFHFFHIFFTNREKASMTISTLQLIVEYLKIKLERLNNTYTTHSIVHPFKEHILVYVYDNHANEPQYVYMVGYRQLVPYYYNEIMKTILNVQGYYEIFQ